MDVLVIGAGITGLSIGQLLSKDFQVKIIEKNNLIGGIAKTTQINNVTYHNIGGHCFNSKHQDVLSFVFKLMPKSEWHKVTRNAKICLGKYEVSYPIEYAVNEIYKHDKNLAYEITKDFLSTNDDGAYSNLEEWFRKKFGNTLADLYMLPYNSKIWGRSPNTMSHEWVEDKLPIPNKVSFFNSLLTTEKDTMPHSEFYYPNTNNQGTFIEKLATGLDIEFNVDVVKIKKINEKWILNDKYEADIIINTMPLNILPSLIEDVPNEILQYASQLKYNKISNVLWESEPTDKTWTYKPSKDSIFHRYIHIGNFFKPIKNYTITEAMGEYSYEEMVNDGRNDPFLKKPIAHNISDHAYTVFDDYRDTAVKNIQNYLEQINLISIGRFGQWEYFNMDVCIKQSIETYKKIIKKYK